MKKKVKAVLIFFFICFFLILFFYHRMATSRQRQNDDVTECINTKFISQKPSFCLENNNINIYEINIQLLRNNQIIKDTVIKSNIENRNQYFIFNIPFDKFLKTDIVVVKTKNRLYKISGFDYSSSGGHWGMFGYLGDSACYFDYDKIKINGKKYVGIK